jgi:hypothetical protein
MATVIATAWEMLDLWVNERIGARDPELSAACADGWEPYAVLYEPRDGQRGFRHFLRRKALHG